MQEETARTHPRPGRRAYLLIALLALALVLFPFLFWYGTWFGRKLSDRELDAYFADRSKPRHIQHALVQLGERISHRQNASRWYPRVTAEAASTNLELRQTAAWIMGQDPAYAPFHSGLLELLRDPAAMVRRNAALSLASFGDGAARGELLAMLRPFPVCATAAGTVRYRVKVGSMANPGTVLAHIGTFEVRSPVPGEVRALEHREGDPVAPGDALAELSPDQDHAWEALRALYLVGQAEDLQAVRRYTLATPNLPESFARQAALTTRAIQARGK